MKLLFVVPRFGPEVVGGAEVMMRGYAHYGVGPDDQVHVATTCARYHVDWLDDFPAGTEMDGDVTVHRFATGPRDPARRHELLAKRTAGWHLTTTEESDLLFSDVWSPDLQRFIRDHGRDYDLMVGAPALFGMVQMASMAHPDRMVLIPCIHDEGATYAKLIRSVLASVRGCIFNSVNERRLVGRLVTVQRSAVVGTGYHIEPCAPITTPIPTGRYVLYAGRMEHAKRVPVVAEYFTRWKAERGSDLRLVLVGDGPWSPPPAYGDAVEMAGTFDDDNERRHIVAGALCVINGSEHESLSNLLLEAWREGRPTLAAAGSEVMTDTSSLSGGGLMFGDYGEFALAMDRYEGDHAFADRMGARGREFMEQEYSWQAVGTRFRAALAHMAP